MTLASKPAPFDSLPLACPIDGLPLSLQDTGVQCANAHSYDRARHGYLNLLPVQFKPSRQPGDSQEMVTARSAVLDAGIFEALARFLVGHLRAQFGSNTGNRVKNDSPVVIDAGCGDGYYSDYLMRNLATEAVEDGSAVAYRLLGVDISRPAITAACKRNAQIGWVVANNTHLPVQSAGADCILSVFGFEAWKPWAVLQKPAQFVVTVDAGSEHLLELRQILYDRVERHNEPSGPTIEAGYRLIERETLCWHHAIDDQALALKLVAMTPHVHRATNEALAELQETVVSSVTLDVVIRTWQRC